MHQAGGKQLEKQQVHLTTVVYEIQTSEVEMTNYDDLRSFQNRKLNYRLVRSTKFPFLLLLLCISHSGAIHSISRRTKNGPGLPCCCSSFQRGNSLTEPTERVFSGLRGGHSNYDKDDEARSQHRPTSCDLSQQQTIKNTNAKIRDESPRRIFENAQKLGNIPETRHGASSRKMNNPLQGQKVQSTYSSESAQSSAKIRYQQKYYKSSSQPPPPPPPPPPTIPNINQNRSITKEAVFNTSSSDGDYSPMQAVQASEKLGQDETSSKSPSESIAEIGRDERTQIVDRYKHDIVGDHVKEDGLSNKTMHQTAIDIEYSSDYTEATHETYVETNSETHSTNIQSSNTTHTDNETKGSVLDLTNVTMPDGRFKSSNATPETENTHIMSSPEANVSHKDTHKESKLKHIDSNKRATSTSYRPSFDKKLINNSWLMQGISKIGKKIFRPDALKKAPFRGEVSQNRKQKVINGNTLVTGLPSSFKGLSAISLPQDTFDFNDAFALMGVYEKLHLLYQPCLPNKDVEHPCRDDKNETNSEDDIIIQEQEKSELLARRDDNDLAMETTILSAAVVTSFMNTIFPIVQRLARTSTHHRIIKIRKRETRVISKTTRPRQTLLSVIDTEVDLKPFEFERLILELSQNLNEEIIEEIEYEYDEEPIFDEIQKCDNEIYEVEHQLEPEDLYLIEAGISNSVDDILCEGDEGDFSFSDNDSCANDETDEGELLDDSDLDILEEASIDGSRWYSVDEECEYDSDDSIA
mmetsp:Transcript_15626/g.23414  ORF Transcript_15626/g.23414 Transcript_15626/m.23414 type:complete len:752 (-) Transcript_15626:107-2362(-)